MAGLGEMRHVAFLGQGASNGVYRVETEKGIFVIKVTKPSAPRRLGVANSFLALANRRVGPGVVLFDDTGRIHPQDFLIEEYVPGIHLHRLDAKAASELGTALARLHSLPIGPFCGTLDQPTWRTYVQDRITALLEHSRAATPEPLHGEIRTMVALVVKQGERLNNRLEARRHCVVHTDVIPLNVIATSDRGMVLIDWEWVRIDVPEWDLASALKAFPMEPDALAAFWEAYGMGNHPEILEFVSILNYLHIVAWRTCAFYADGEYRDVADKFLADLEVEMDWLRSHLSLPISG